MTRSRWILVTLILVPLWSACGPRDFEPPRVDLPQRDAGSRGYTIADRWKSPDYQQTTFGKFMVVGITDDAETRRRFEDKFVSHLRGRKLEAVTSYSIVPDLTSIADRTEIVAAIEEQSIQAVISVRLVSMASTTPEAWAGSWRETTTGSQRLRELIDESLPLPAKPVGPFGVEIALWDTKTGARVWAGRTESYKLKQLQRGAGEIVQRIMDRLRVDSLV